MDKNIIEKNRFLLAILLVSFLFCFGYAIYYQIQPTVDARAYDSIAGNIVLGNGYRENIAIPIDYDFSIARVGPLYEYFLAGVYKIFGHSYLAVWFLQALLHAASAWLVYLAALRIFARSDKREVAALSATAIFGLYPDLIEISAMLMTETLYLFLFCLMLYMFFALLERGDRGYLPAACPDLAVVALGLVAGLAVLARPPVLFLLPVVLFYFYQEKMFRQGLCFILIMTLVFIPWTARNYQVYGELIPFGVAGQLNFWIGNHLGGQGLQEVSPEIVDFAKSHPLKELSAESMKQFKSFILNHPKDFLRLTILRINRYFSVIRPMGFWFYASGWRQMVFVISSALASVILFILGLAGAIKMFEEKNRSYFYLLAFIVATPLILFITVVETRYRFQIYPLLALTAGYFMATFDSKDGDTRKILLISSALIFLNAGTDLLMNFGKVLGRIGEWF